MAEAVADPTLGDALKFEDAITLPEDMYWVVYVTDHLMLPDNEVSITRRRFEFHGPTASVEAWHCYQNAKRHEFTARAEKVRKV